MRIVRHDSDRCGMSGGGVTFCVISTARHSKSCMTSTLILPVSLCVCVCVCVCVCEIMLHMQFRVCVGGGGGKGVRAYVRAR